MISNLTWEGWVMFVCILLILWIGGCETTGWRERCEKKIVAWSIRRKVARRKAEQWRRVLRR